MSDEENFSRIYKFKNHKMNIEKKIKYERRFFSEFLVNPMRNKYTHVNIFPWNNTHRHCTCLNWTFQLWN